MLDATDLRHLIQAKLAEGRLPWDRFERVWGGTGLGQVCAACDETISKTQVGIESLRASETSLFFHLRCFAAWESVRLLERTE